MKTEFSSQNCQCMRNLDCKRQLKRPKLGIRCQHENTQCILHKRLFIKENQLNHTDRKKNRGIKKKFRKENKLKRALGTRTPCRVQEFEDDRKRGREEIDPQLFLTIESSIVDCERSEEIRLDNIFGHERLKDIINRTIIWPLKKPDVFKGLRSAPKGVLLFGPSGGGKTLLGRCIAFETKSTFFNISPSLLTSKYMGDSEKLVRTMFTVAKARQPSVIFIDDIDSILSKRTPYENGSSRRMKNEFLLQMDEAIMMPEDRILVIGATNRPQELDSAARRRFVKRLYIPLPDEFSRREFLRKLLDKECHSLEDIDIIDIVRKTDGYSIADLKSLVQEAAMGSIKVLSPQDMMMLKQEKIRPINPQDFAWALELIKPSISTENLRGYETWDTLYGYGSECQRS